MATTSIWSVKGWLGKVVIYIENLDKTENPDYVRNEELTEKDSQGLSDVITYAVDCEKTKRWIEGDDECQFFYQGILRWKGKQVIQYQEYRE